MTLEKDEQPALLIKKHSDFDQRTNSNPQSKNSLCKDCTAFLPSSSDTMRDMLFLEAPWLIILTLMPSRPRTLKTCEHTYQIFSQYNLNMHTGHAAAPTMVDAT